MSVYVVARIDSTDRERYSEYEAGFMDVFTSHDGEIVAVDDAPEFIEGEGVPHRCVLLRFPSREQFAAWYESDAYQTLAAARWDASTATITLVRGFA